MATIVVYRDLDHSSSWPVVGLHPLPLNQEGLITASPSRVWRKQSSVTSGDKQEKGQAASTSFSPTLVVWGASPHVKVRFPWGHHAGETVYWCFIWESQLGSAVQSHMPKCQTFEWSYFASTSQVPRITAGDAAENKASARSCPNLGPRGFVKYNDYHWSHWVWE